MKGFIEFKGYRTRTAYDPESKGFVARRAEYPDFDIRDSEVLSETQVKPFGPSMPKLRVQQVHPEPPGERATKPRNRSKTKPKANVAIGSSVAMAK